MTTQPLKFEFDPQFGSMESGADRWTEGFPTPDLVPEGGEDWRVTRLAATWGQACAAVRLLSHRYQRHWAGAITELCDHKGTLQVTWRDEQSRVIFEGVIMGAWEREGEHGGAHRATNEAALA